MRTLRRASAPDTGCCFSYVATMAPVWSAITSWPRPTSSSKSPVTRIALAYCAHCETAAGHRRRVCAVMIAACSGRTISRAPGAAA